MEETNTNNIQTLFPILISHLDRSEDETRILASYEFINSITLSQGFQLDGLLSLGHAHGGHGVGVGNSLKTSVKGGLQWNRSSNNLNPNSAQDKIGNIRQSTISQPQLDSSASNLKGISSALQSSSADISEQSGLPKPRSVAATAKLSPQLSPNRFIANSIQNTTKPLNSTETPSSQKDLRVTAEVSTLLEATSTPSDKTDVVLQNPQQHHLHKNINTNNSNNNSRSFFSSDRLETPISSKFHSHQQTIIGLARKPSLTFIVNVLTN
jgi:hypothetical protein